MKTKNFKFFREIGRTCKGEPLFLNLKTLKFAVDRGPVALVEIDESELLGLKVCSCCQEIKVCHRKGVAGNVLCENCYQLIMADLSQRGLNDAEI